VETELTFFLRKVCRDDVQKYIKMKKDDPEILPILYQLLDLWGALLSSLSHMTDTF